MFGSSKSLMGARLPGDGPIARPYESTRVSDQRRFEDEPEPTDDDQISKSFWLNVDSFSNRESLP